jgi:catechol 2,3-dioxygenase-like lactoylglutathione lyase family enzyme
MSAAMRLTSVRIFVDNLEKAAAFYEDVIGLNRTTTAPTAILFEESPSIVVETTDDDGRRDGLIGRFTGVAFEAKDAAALYADLKARGVPLHGPPEKQYWGGIMLFAEDPSGNVITFLQHPAAAARNRGP